MDTLKKVEHLGRMARREPEPLFAPDEIMGRIAGMAPDPAVEEYPVRLLFDMAVAASAVAAAVTVVALAAWADLHNPFLALETLGSVLERL